MNLTRRAFLLGLAGLAAGCASRVVAPAPAGRDPFTLGVASGYPRPHGFVLWTRLAPEPLAAGGGMPPAPVPVAWEVSADETFARVLARGEAMALPELAHAVHVEVDGLEPGRWYHYRFRTGDAVSAVGRTRTAPDGAVSRLALAFASCQHYEHGHYAAYRHMAAEPLDLVVHVGDYIYESSFTANTVRSHGAGEAMTLEDYRRRYALYRLDPALQGAHAAFPWLVVWDDHEVDNDYANDRSQDWDEREAFLARRAAAYQAYYEHMPLPRTARPSGPTMRLYAQAGFGSLARLFVLDGRQYRDPQPCPRPWRSGGRTVGAENCPERLDPARSMLGAAQERWLTEGFQRTRTRWNLIAQQTMMAQADRQRGPDRAFWTDNWDGYPAARRRLLGALAVRRVSNPLVLSGDIHAFAVSELKLDFDDPRSPPVASELVTTSISSRGFSWRRIQEMVEDNPHIKFADSRFRGYTTLELTPDRAVARLRALHDARNPESPIRTLAEFAVENGRPGPRRRA